MWSGSPHIRRGSIVRKQLIAMHNSRSPLERVALAHATVVWTDKDTISAYESTN